MPAPVECKAAVNIHNAEATYKRPQPATVVTLNCDVCPVGSRSFIADSKYFINPQGTAVRNAQEFLAKACGLKVDRSAVILPRGL